VMFLAGRPRGIPDLTKLVEDCAALSLPNLIDSGTLVFVLLGAILNPRMGARCNVKEPAVRSMTGARGYVEDGGALWYE